MAFTTINSFNTLANHLIVPPLTVDSFTNCNHIQTSDKHIYLFNQNGTITFKLNSNLNFNNTATVIAVGAGGGGAGQTYATVYSNRYKCWGSGGGAGDVTTTVNSLCGYPLVDVRTIVSDYIFFLPYNDGLNIPTIDSTGNYTITNNNTTSISPLVMFNEPTRGYILNTNGTNDNTATGYLTTNLIHSGGVMSISQWIYLIDNKTDSRSWCIQHTSTQDYFQANYSKFHSSTGQVSTTIPAAVGTWIHNTVTFSTTKCTIYKNGVAVSTITMTPPLTGNILPTSYINGTYTMNGYQDNFRYYNRTLSADEVLSIYTKEYNNSFSPFITYTEGTLQTLSIIVGSGGAGSSEIVNYDYPKNIATVGQDSAVSTLSINSIIQAENIMCFSSGGKPGTTFFGGASGSGLYPGSAAMDISGGGAGGSGAYSNGFNGDTFGGAGGYGYYLSIIDEIINNGGSSYLTNQSPYVAAGGGGGASEYRDGIAGLGGLGGGGNGGNGLTTALNGTANTGSGGGGGGSLGGTGASGLVIVYINK
jgi:hypothetical protein